MMKTILALVVVLLISLIFWLLYRNGYLVTRSMHAVSFTCGLGGKKGSFSGCTGMLRRVVRFKEARPYRFEFGVLLKKGEVYAELWDSKGNVLFTLSQETPRAEITPDPAARYTLVYHFEKATGRFAIDWE